MVKYLIRCYFSPYFSNELCPNCPNVSVLPGPQPPTSDAPGDSAPRTPPAAESPQPHRSSWPPQTAPWPCLCHHPSPWNWNRGKHDRWYRCFVTHENCIKLWIMWIYMHMYYHVLSCTHVFKLYHTLFNLYCNIPCDTVCMRMTHVLCIWFSSGVLTQFSGCECAQKAPSKKEARTLHRGSHLGINLRASGQERKVRKRGQGRETL